MIADLTGYGVRTLSGNPARAVRTGGLAAIADPMVGLMAYWKLDTAAAGLTPDATGNGNDLGEASGTLDNSVSKLGGWCYRGSGGFALQRVESTQLIPGPTGFTMQGWFRRIGTTGTFSLMGRFHSGGQTGDLDFRLGAFFGTGAPRTLEFAVKNAANNVYTVFCQGVGYVELQWYHICCGYDASLQQIWIQVNGAQRQVLSGINNVRLSIPNFTITNDMDLSNAASGYVDEAAFWNRSLSDGEVVMLYNSGNARAYPFVGTVPPSRPSLDPTDVWALQVQANGGAAPSGATVSAVKAFITGCVADGIWPDMLAANVIAPDSVIAALTPIKGGTLWVNHGLVSGDLTVNGLKGDGSAKYVDTGFIPNAGGQTSISAGLVIYISVDDATTAQIEIGCNGPLSSAQMAFYPHYNSTSSTFSCWRFDVPGANTLQNWTIPSPAAGFYSGQRTAANAIAVYFASSNASHAALATGSGTQSGSVEATNSLFLLADNNGAPASFSKKRVSFVAMTDGMSAAKSALLYARVQALRVALGGGYV